MIRVLVVVVRNTRNVVVKTNGADNMCKVLTEILNTKKDIDQKVRQIAESQLDDAYSTFMIKYGFDLRAQGSSLKYNSFNINDDIVKLYYVEDRDADLLGHVELVFGGNDG
jgi:hypothetical protein